MMIPVSLLLLLAVIPAHGALPMLSHATASFMAPFGGGTPPPVDLASASPALAWVSVALALAIAALNLFRERLPQPLTRSADLLTRPALKGIKALHSGLVGDYVTWIVVGLAVFAVASLR